MSNWDYVMPHRLFINRSLRKETDKLRTKIDKYHATRERKNAEFQIEIQLAGQTAEKQFERLKESLEQELAKDTTLLTHILNDFTEYADYYYRKECLRKKRSIRKAQYKYLEEDDRFYTGLMTAIGDEIQKLRDRQDELNSFTDVSDIIQLSFDSGNRLGFNVGDDARTLLEIVNAEKSTCNEDQKIERYALQRLKDIISERSEYVPVIKYIEWIIQQKIRYSKQLSNQRAYVRELKPKIEKSIDEMNNEIQLINNDLEGLSKKIRETWEIPIKGLDDKIKRYKREKDDLYDELDRIKRDQQSAKSWKEYDKLESLSRDWDHHVYEIESVKSYLTSAYRQRDEWYKRRDIVKQICKEYEIWFDFYQRTPRREKR